MTRASWLGVGLLLVLGTVGRAAPVPTDRSALAQVPASAPLVLYLHGLEGTKDRLLVLVKNALPELLPRIQPHLDSVVKDGIEGRKLAGVPKDGPVFIVLTELPPAEPTQRFDKFAVVLAVTSYTEFRDNLLKEDERKGIKPNEAGVERAVIEGEPAYFVDRKGYAIVSPNEEVANALAKKAAGLDGKMSAPLQKKFLAGDLGLYLSMDAFNKDYAAQIKKAREGLEGLVEQVADSAGKGQRGAIDQARKLIGPAFQAVEDSQGVLVTVEFRPGGLALHVQSELRPGSNTATALKETHQSEFPELGRMPPGQVFYTGVETSRRLLEALGGLALGAADADSQDAKAVGKALEKLARAGPGARVESSSVPPAGVQVWHFEDPAAAVAAELDLLQATGSGGTLQGGALKEKPVVKKAAKKYGDVTLHAVELTWDLEKMGGQGLGGGELPEEARKQLAEGMKAFLGEKLRFWFGTDGKAVIQVTARDWEQAEKLLDDYYKSGKGVGNQAAFREVRKEMPAEATFLALADVVKYTAALVDLAKPVIKVLPFPLFLPEGFPAKQDKGAVSYAGLAVTLSGERASLDVLLSAPAIHEAYKVFVMPFMPANP
jgi:hypothetical protein